MSAALPVPAGPTSKPTMLWRLAGILALVAGASIALGIVSTYFDGYFRWETALSIVTALLAIAGGVLALQAKRDIAPWLILAATIFGWGLDRFVIGFPLFLPWEPVLQVGDIVDALGPVGGLIRLLELLSIWILLLSAVLAIVAFIKTPASPTAASVNVTHATTLQGAAIVSDDGTVASGWYADPDGKPAERYWDGTAWSDQTRPMTTSTAPIYTGVASKPTVTPTGEPISPNSRAAAAIICFVVGVLGIHRFYVGKNGTGVAMLLTLGGLGIWALIDFIWILVGTFKDKNGRVLANW